LKQNWNINNDRKYDRKYDHNERNFNLWGKRGSRKVGGDAGIS
jgi:hypothetical protein